MSTFLPDARADPESDFNREVAQIKYNATLTLAAVTGK